MNVHMAVCEQFNGINTQANKLQIPDLSLAPSLALSFVTNNYHTEIFCQLNISND